MKGFIGYCMVIIGLISCTCCPFIYQADVLRKWDPARLRYHYFIGCSDFHEKSSIISDMQMHDISTAFHYCNKESIKVIVEDLSSPGSNGALMCGRFF